MVTDFGLAKVMDENSISVQGDMVGTYVYMSPELAAEGPVVSITARTSSASASCSTSS